MGKQQSMILVPFLALMLLRPCHAQTPVTTPPASSNVAVPPAPSGQAPDDMTKKITDLVHTGKYTEAQQLTNGLLIAYPDDQRLIKAKALIDKLLAPPAPANEAPASSPPTNNAAPPQPASNPNAERLTGMDKVDYNALIELARQAQQTKDLDEQKKLLQQFMDQSAPFLQKHPDLTLLWQFRVVSAISLNEPMLGYEAGQKLLAAGAANRNDPALQQLLAQLRNKGWLDKQEAERQAAVARTDWVLGTWSVSWSHIDQSGHVLKTGNEYIDFSRIDSKLEGCIFHGAKPTHFTYCSVRIEVLDTGKLQCENLIAESVWQPLSCETGDQNRTMKVEYLPRKEGDRYSWLLHKE
jgi:hypothetical protein